MRKNKNNGFSFIELLIAVSILSIVVAAFLGLAYRGVATSSLSKNNITGQYLAQDAIEFIKSGVENNIAQGDSDWLNGFRGCNGGNKCTINTLEDLPNKYINEICAPAGCSQIKYNKDLNLYGYYNGAKWQDSGFTREVQIEEISADAEVAVTVDVFWKSGLMNKSVTLHSNFYNIITP